MGLLILDVVKKGKFSPENGLKTLKNRQKWCVLNFEPNMKRIDFFIFS